MKPYKKQIIRSMLIVLSPIAVGLLLWNRLPDQIAIHFNANGVADGWAGKPFTVFGLPLLLGIIHWISVVVALNDPQKQNIGKQMMTLLFWITPALSCVVIGSIYAIALDVPMNPSTLVFLLMGQLFLILGNYMTKNHQNYTIGIRLPWTLNSKENWNRTHRLASRLWMLAGVVMILNVFFQLSWLILPVVILISVIPMIYSFILYKKGI